MRDQSEDKKLINYLRKGDREAFDTLYRKYWQPLFETAYKRIKFKEPTEEIIQEIFVDLWVKRKELEINKSFAVYIFSALKYKVLNWKRGELIKAKHLNDLGNRKSNSKNSLEETLEVNELNRILNKEINRLPEKCRRVYQLSRNENLSIPEIANHLQISVSTVEKHLGKALRSLRTNLQDYITILVICIASIVG